MISDDEEEVEGTSIFEPLLDKLRSTNSASFRLPQELQTYFAGVEALENGEYADDSKKRVPV